MLSNVSFKIKMYTVTKFLYDKFPWVYRLRQSLDKIVESVVLSIDKLYYAKREFRRVFHRRMDLVHPKNLVEKFYWIERNADLSLISKCSDKERVRDFVKERGCGEILNTLYGRWDNPEEIDFNTLPQCFILKPNNGSGDTVIVKDKDLVSESDIIAYLRRVIDNRYGLHNAQNHYRLIKPSIIAEKLLPVENAPCGSSLVDYKVWCFNGVPKYVLVIYDRTKEHASIALFNTDWKPLPQYLKPTNHLNYRPDIQIHPPKSLSKMLSYASILSKGFPEVRVDFYEVSNNPIFGEMTFTTGYGYFTDEFYNHLGDLTDLSIL